MPAGRRSTRCRPSLPTWRAARSQTVELAKAGSAIALGAVAVSMLVTAAFMAALWFVVRQEILAASREIAYILPGTLGAKPGRHRRLLVGISSAWRRSPRRSKKPS